MNQETEQTQPEVLQIKLADGYDLPVIIPRDLRVFIWPHSELTTPCKDIPIETIHQKDFQSIIAYMLLTMYKMQGIGLAANQVGLKYNCFVWDIKWHIEEKISPNVIFNPKIIESYDDYLSGEGCLSCPGVKVPVKRGHYAEIQGLDIHGKEVNLVAEGLEAACFQHECDHLNGKTIMNQLSQVKRDIYRRKSLKYRKQVRGQHEPVSAGK